MLAIKVLPEGKKRKHRATVHISIGNMIGDLLEFGCLRIDNKDISADDNGIVSK